MNQASALAFNKRMRKNLGREVYKNKNFLEFFFKSRISNQNHPTTKKNEQRLNYLHWALKANISRGLFIALENKNKSKLRKAHTCLHLTISVLR